MRRLIVVSLAAVAALWTLVSPAAAYASAQTYHGVSRLSTTSPSLTSARLKWINPKSSHYLGVTIRRALGHAPSATGGIRVATLSRSRRSFTDSGLSKGTRYGYTVLARYRDHGSVAVHRLVTTRTDTLGTGSALTSGQELWSSDGRYRAVMQTDGNFVEYGPGGAVWSSATAGSGGHDSLIMQSDGNLVVYGSNGAAWSSSTHGSQNDSLVMQSDGNLVIYGNHGAVWAGYGISSLGAGLTLGTGGYLRSADGRFRAVMQEDGNFVEYGPSGATWSSKTSGTQNYLAMQSDGNLVVYSASGAALWSSSTAGSGSSDQLVMQSDGNLVVYGSNGAVWASLSQNTGRGPIGDDYPANLKNAAQDSVLDPWRFYNRECTSFVAWRLNSQNGVGFTDFYGGPKWGNANNWGPTARSLGITVNSTPAPGAVAWSNAGQYGHVAWVADVRSDGSIDIEQYNADYHGTYSTAHLPASAFTGYIHIKDLG